MLPPLLKASKIAYIKLRDPAPEPALLRRTGQLCVSKSASCGVGGPTNTP